MLLLRSGDEIYTVLLGEKQEIRPAFDYRTNPKHIYGLGGVAG